MFSGINNVWIYALPDTHWIWTWFRMYGVVRPIVITEAQRSTFWNLPIKER